MSPRRQVPPPPGPLAPAGPIEGTPGLVANPPPAAPEEPPQMFGPPEGAEDRHLVGPPVEAEPELSPEEQVMFASLLTCGRRSKTLTIFDHTVVVQTLCGDDDLRIGLYAKQYAGSFGEQRAYQIAVAAAGIRTIDGKPLVQGLFDQATDDALFDQKVAKVAQMYPTVINKIYRCVLDAEQEFVELATKLGKFGG
jgi:hypothetical protein